MELFSAVVLIFFSSNYLILLYTVYSTLCVVFAIAKTKMFVWLSFLGGLSIVLYLYRYKFHLNDVGFPTWTHAMHGMNYMITMAAIKGGGGEEGY